MEQKRLILFLDEEISSALLSMSREDYRNPTLETLWILRKEAERRGLLIPQAQPTQLEPIAEGVQNVSNCQSSDVNAPPFFGNTAPAIFGNSAPPNQRMQMQSA